MFLFVTIESLEIKKYFIDNNPLHVFHRLLSSTFHKVLENIRRLTKYVFLALSLATRPFRLPNPPGSLFWTWPVANGEISFSRVGVGRVPGHAFAQGGRAGGRNARPPTPYVVLR